MNAPYKLIVPEAPGGADLIDRATDKEIGYVLKGFYQVWTGYLTAARGVPVVRARTRSEAARLLWDHHADPAPMGETT